MLGRHPVLNFHQIFIWALTTTIMIMTTRLEAYFRYLGPRIDVQCRKPSSTDILELEVCSQICLKFQE